jgi:hypothetical protein
VSKVKLISDCAAVKEVEARSVINEMNVAKNNFFINTPIKILF